jgi:hypothetical protein
VIVSRRLAQKMWPGRNPIGQQIAYPLWQGPRRPPFEVVGVAGDVKHLALTSDAPLLLYVPIFQEFSGRASVVVRTASDAHAGILDIQRAMAATDKHVIARLAQTGPEHSADSLWQQRLAAGWIGAFSVMALFLAAVGLYAVVAQSVAQRTREIGIRMALGADRGAVAGLVVKQGMRLSLAGIAIGFPAAIACNGLVRRYLAGIEGRGLVAVPWLCRVGLGSNLARYFGFGEAGAIWVRELPHGPCTIVAPGTGLHSRRLAPSGAWIAYRKR